MSSTPKKYFAFYGNTVCAEYGVGSGIQSSLKACLNEIEDANGGEIHPEDATFFEVVPLKVEVIKEVRQVVTGVKQV